MQFSEQCLSISTDAVNAGKDKRANRPAAGNGNNKIVGVAEHGGHVVSLVLQLSFVRGKPGCKVAVAYLLPVDLCLVNT